MNTQPAGRDGSAALPRRAGWEKRETVMQCKIRFIFSARQVREHDYNSFLNAFRFDQIPNTAIRRYVDALQLEVEAAEGDLRPPYVIPEIRRHFRQLAKRWPHAAFCCDLGTPFLSHYALCQWDNLRVLQRGESQQVLIAYMVRDLYRFCKQGNAQIRAAGRRAGMSRDEIIHREIAFTRYLLLVGLQPAIQGSQHG